VQTDDSPERKSCWPIALLSDFKDFISRVSLVRSQPPLLTEV
jgi:hypothetical protein